ELGGGERLRAGDVDVVRLGLVAGWVGERALRRRRPAGYVVGVRRGRARSGGGGDEGAGRAVPDGKARDRCGAGASAEVDDTECVAGRERAARHRREGPEAQRAGADRLAPALAALVILADRSSKLGLEREQAGTEFGHGLAPLV